MKRILIALSLFVCALCTLPVHATLVGTTPGEFAVSPSGAATYTVPIELPPTVGGVKPSLALSYNSQAGNGIAGIGWGLSGLSSITRCPTTLAQDGFIDGVDFDGNDKFCLDGQRLVEMPDGTYRTEIDTFSRIRIVGSIRNPLSFIVDTKSGEKITYEADAKYSSEVYSWRQKTLEDKLGNKAIYNYFTNAFETYLTSINIGSVEVYFSHEFRPDQEKWYTSKIERQLNQRLKDITISLSGTTVRTYSLSYQPNIEQSKLTNITRCEKNTNTCLQAIDFIWDTAGVNVFGNSGVRTDQYSDAHGWATSEAHYSTISYVDVNGDGIADACGRYADGVKCKLSNGHDFSAGSITSGGVYGDSTGWGADSKYWGSIRYPDLNGDGLADICGYSKSGLLCGINTGSGFASFKLWTSTYNEAGEWSSHEKHYGSIQYVDINADGRADVCGYSNYGILCETNDGSHFSSGKFWSTTFSDTNGWGEDAKHYNSLQYVELNGDGLLDVCGYSPTGIYCEENSGEGFTAGKVWTNDYSDAAGWGDHASHHGTIRYPDLNGDGLSDICGRSSSGLLCSLNTGITLKGASDWSNIFSNANGWNGHESYYTTISYVDLNRDGKADVCGRSGSGIICQMSDGKTFGTASTWNTSFSNANNWHTHRSHYSTIRYADITGDGFIDVCGRSTSGIVCGNNSIKEQRLVEFNNKLQPTIKLLYIRPSSNFVSSAEFRTTNNAVTAVWAVDTENGKGGYNRLTYEYENLKSNVLRGLLGFEKIKTIDQSTGSIVETTYSQTFPYIGAAISSVGKLHGKTISESNSSYTHINTPWFVYPKTSSQKSWSYNSDGTTTPLTETITSNDSFNAYGDPKKITVTVKDLATNAVHTTVTTNTYKPADTSNWILGRLETAKVTHTPASGIGVIEKESSFAYYDVGTPQAGLLKQETIEPNQPLHKLVTDYEYDPYGNRTKVTVTGNQKTFSANGTASLGAQFTRETNTEYLAGADHPAGLFPTKVTNAKGHSETRVYDPLYGNVLKTTGPNGIPTSFEYDALGRNVKTIPAVGKPSITSYAWCAAGGNCPDANGYTITKTVADVTGSATLYFDRYGRSVRKASTDRNNALIYVDTEYDSLGRVSRVSEPSYTAGDFSKFTISHYDAVGRVDSVTGPNGIPVTTSFNGLTTTTTTTNNGIARNTITEKNALGQTIRIEDPLGGSVAYEYDAVGNLLKTTTCEAGNNCVDVDLEYDLRGNKIKMIDPDMGTWLYGYNTLGELTWQKDAKSQVTQMEYDVLGRMDKRTDDDGTVSEWVYDTAAGKGVGKLHKVLLNNSVFKELSYDSVGRPTQTISTIDGFSYATNSTYDSVYGRLDTLQYPSADNATGANRSGLTLKYNYSATGRLSSVVNADQLDTKYWTAGTLCSNKPGALCSEFLGDRSTAVNGFTGIQVSSTYHDINPWLMAQSANQQGNYLNSYQHFDYSYDDVGNLKSRGQNAYSVGGNANAKTETFNYDNLDRVLDATTNGTVTGTYTYDGLGNIDFKNDVGTYTYGAAASTCNADTFAGPHAVTQTTLNGVTTNYCYDNNGNLLNGNGRTVTWNSFNKPIRMEQNGKWAEFSYGPNRSRYKKTSPDFDAIHYVGMGGTGNVLYEKEMQANGGYVARNHIYVGGKRIAVKLDYHNAQINDPEVVHYMLGDHLGSVTTIVNQDGNVVRRKSFDVWGKARNADTWSGTAALDTDNHRGYTGHESIQEVGLVHMNGRVYDAALARFVSADPHIQSAGSSQSYNRYSYVWNNPLANTDPSGYFLKKIGKELRRTGKRIDREARRAGGWGVIFNAPHSAQIGYHTHAGAVRNIPGYAQASTIVAGIVCSPAGNGAACAAGMTSLNAKLQGASFSDAVKAGLISYASGAAFNGVHNWNAEGWMHLAKGAVHGGIGGLASISQGGSFQDGFVGAAFSYGASNAKLGGQNVFDKLGAGDSFAKNGAIAAVIGGTASVASGGKFANGAVSGAFSRLFNEMWKGTFRARTASLGGGWMGVKMSLTSEWRNNQRLAVELDVDGTVLDIGAPMGEVNADIELMGAYVPSDMPVTTSGASELAGALTMKSFLPSFGSLSGFTSVYVGDTISTSISTTRSVDPTLIGYGKGIVRFRSIRVENR